MKECPNECRLNGNLVGQRVNIKLNFQLRPYDPVWKRWTSARTSFARSQFKAWIRRPHTRRHNHYQRTGWCVCGCNWRAHCWAWWSNRKMTLTLMFILDCIILAFFKETLLRSMYSIFNNCVTFLKFQVFSKPQHQKWFSELIPTLLKKVEVKRKEKLFTAFEKIFVVNLQQK